MIAHLFRRAGFGARPEELDDWEEQGLEAAVDYLVNFEHVEDNLVDLPDMTGCEEPTFDETDRLAVWWLNAMATTTRPLQEKMVLFWHHLFATSAAGVNHWYEMYLQNQNWRGYFDPDTGLVTRGLPPPFPLSPFPVGDFRQMLVYLTKDSAMLPYLDNASNFILSEEVGSNENYARELLELFSMGRVDPVTQEPNYTERDVRQASRALTAWSAAPADPMFCDEQQQVYNFLSRAFQFYEESHDIGPYDIFGQVGGSDADFLFDLIVTHKKSDERPSAVGRFLGFRLFRFFGYHQPEPEIIDALADVFDGEGVDEPYIIRNLLATIFTPGNVVSEAFYSTAIHEHVKSPTEMVVSAFRQLSPDGLGLLTPELSVQLANPELGIMGTMGQPLFYPPNVSGWREGPAWISTSSLLGRIEFANFLTTVLQPGAGGIDVQAIMEAHNLTPDNPRGIVDYFVDLLWPIEASVLTRQVLTDYLMTPSEIPEENTPENFVPMKVRGLLAVILSLPGFQFS
jgi:uncharacterized protein (DUF1800 family)